MKMNERSMQCVQTTVERKHIRPNTKAGLCMSALHPTSQLVDAITRQMQKITVFTVKVLASISVSWTLSEALKPIAFEQRGYHAYGGEMLLVISAFLFLMYVLTMKPKGGKRRK